MEEVNIGDDRVEAAFDEALSPFLTLSNGGRLRIERTHALTAVDIDSAGRRGQGSAASRALQLNLDACQMLARQLRLRQLCGLVILDCVAPLNAGSRQKLRDAMKSHLETAGFPTATILAPSQLGLMEMSLPWRETPLEERLLEPDGTPSGETLCLTGLRLLEREARHRPMDRLTLALPARALSWLETEGAPLPSLLSGKYGQRFTFLASTKPDPAVYQTT